MKMTPWLACLLLACAALPAVATISIEGEVLRPGVYPLPEGARLSNAAIEGQVSQSAWPLGAAWLREQERDPQTRLKAGLLFDLQSASVSIQASRRSDSAALLQRLHAQVSAMPVTGRVSAELAPLQLLITGNNFLLESGDRLLFPRRPDQVRVVGAVEADCSLPFAADLQLRDYLRQCTRHSLADPSYVWVIQPDGSYQQVGIGYWNRESSPVAVGAVIYRPILQRLLGDTPDLNADMAAWLATQYTLGGDFDE